MRDEDIEKIFDEAESEIKIERESFKKMLESEEIYIDAVYPNNLTSVQQLHNYKGKGLHYFIESELERINKGKPRKSEIPVELLESTHELHKIFGDNESS